jgi:hypothetical protein
VTTPARVQTVTERLYDLRTEIALAIAAHVARRAGSQGHRGTPNEQGEPCSLCVLIAQRAVSGAELICTEADRAAASKRIAAKKRRRW